MNSIISINRKFMEMSPKKLIRMIKNTKYVKGLEISVDVNSSFELKYLDELVNELKENNMILQIHGDSELPLEVQLEFLRKVTYYSNYLRYKIVVTFHPVYNPIKEKSIVNTINYMKDIIENIDNDKIVVCIENLNNLPECDRLSKEDIIPIILGSKLLYFTYDLGHELMNNRDIANLNKEIITKIKNVHIHTNNGHGYDHMPIYQNDKYLNDLMNGLSFIINNKYQDNAVYEYDLYECHGNSIEERIVDYLNSIDYVSSQYL